MRFLNKYKNFNTILPFLNQCSPRVLKFKRPKWKKVQNNLKLTNNLLFVNNLISKLNYKSWDKLKLHYKEGIQSKKAILNFFDNSLSSTYYKKQLLFGKKKLFIDFILNFFIKPMFKLDILLWKLHIFNSPFESRQAIKNGLIFRNNQKFTNSTEIKLGDIISFSSKINFKQYIFNSNYDNSLLFSFLEIDYYSGTIVFIKNFKQLSNEDFSTLFFDSINLKSFIDYIKTK